MKLPTARFWARFLPGFIKRRVPKTLGARAILIIVAPIVIMQVAITFVFFQMHWESVTTKLSEGLAGEIGWVVDSYEKEPSLVNLSRLNAEASENMQLSIVLQPQRDLPTHKRRSLYVALDRSLKRALSDQITQPFWFDTTRYPGVVDIRIKVKAGVLRIIAPKERAFATTGHIFIFWVLCATMLLTTVAVLFIRNQVRAIEILSKAAEAFGKGEDYPNFKPYGATEVRAAAQAFLDMRERIVRQIEQRTMLLASVSHDLRTPLTRLKLALAMQPFDPEVERMKRDVSEMSYVIDEYLEFARGDATENVEHVSVNQFMAELADNAQRSGQALDIKTLDYDFSISIRRQAMTRALNNLVNNAFHHANHVVLSAHLMTEATGAVLELHIDDDGPGIAPEHREEAFKAFSRIDQSRNQNVKGVGLGLAISRDIIRNHGGDIVLEQSSLGGLRARIHLSVKSSAQA